FDVSLVEGLRSEEHLPSEAQGCQERGDCIFGSYGLNEDCEREAEDAKAQIANKEVANISDRELPEHLPCWNAQLRTHVHRYETRIHGVVRKGSEGGGNDQDPSGGLMQRRTSRVKGVEQRARGDNREGYLAAIVKSYSE